ncbi:hypothetical protein K505DRAFT_358076 [Melanomma pulvis-pyrius CBS 109.77]|uniref:C2H2-type domain-containing protein n=1 Tax=Melanomma pulvis-pyrius CBS 109.77 TaxID=1314802 RepID=A0A6A6XNR1_9PLEO|nr:hypothetical protein K505DRAFT_358076 [Melanomma pulvis-pyrius CBS 109.77]
MQRLDQVAPAIQKPTNEGTKDVQTPAPANGPLPRNTEGPAVQRLLLHEHTNVTRSDTIPSEIQVHSFRPATSTVAPSSTASASEAGGLSTAGPFEVPPAPQLDEEEREKMCPYCCLVFPRKLFSTQRKSLRWKKHLLDDLQPYICLFKNCDQAGKTYRSFKDWQAHLNSPHDQDWACPLPHPEADTAEEQTIIFDTASQFQSHLDLYHPDLGNSSTHGIFRTASHPAVLPQWCFVCLAEQTSEVALHKHLANHLESAFLLALPGRDDIEDAIAVSSGRPSSGTAESSTVCPPGTELPDVRGLYSDVRDEESVQETQEISSNEFTSRLLPLSIGSTSIHRRVGLFNPWREQPMSVAEGPRLSSSWRVLISVIMLTVRFRKLYDRKMIERLQNALVSGMEDRDRNYPRFAPRNIWPTDPGFPSEDIWPTDPGFPSEDIWPTDPGFPSEDIWPTDPGFPSEDMLSTYPGSLPQASYVLAGRRQRDGQAPSRGAA